MCGANRFLLLLAAILLPLCFLHVWTTEAAKYNATEVYECEPGCFFNTIRWSPVTEFYYVGASTGSFIIDHEGAIVNIGGDPITSFLPTKEGTIYISRDHCLESATTYDLSSRQPLAGKCDEPWYTDGTTFTARFRTPRGLAISSDSSSLYVADTGNSAIRKIFDLSSPDKWVSTIYFRPEFGETRAVATQGDDVLFIAHALCVVKYNLTSNATTLLAGNCAQSGNADALAGLSARFVSIMDMVYAWGKLFVADQALCAYRMILLGDNNGPASFVRSVNDYVPGGGSSTIPITCVPNQQSGFATSFSSPVGIVPRGSDNSDGGLYAVDRTKIYRLDPYIRIDNKNDSALALNERELALVSNDGDFAPLQNDNKVTVYIGDQPDGYECVVFAASTVSVNCSFYETVPSLAMNTSIGVRVFSNVSFAPEEYVQLQTSQVDWVAITSEPKAPAVFLGETVYYVNATEITIFGKRFNTTTGGNYISINQGGQGYVYLALGLTSNFSTGRMLTFNPVQNGVLLLAGANLQVMVSSNEAQGSSGFITVGTVAKVQLPSIGVYVSTHTNSIGYRQLTLLLYSPTTSLFSDSATSMLAQEAVKLFFSTISMGFISNPPVACIPQATNGFTLTCSVDLGNETSSDASSPQYYSVCYQGVILRTFQLPPNDFKIPVATPTPNAMIRSNATAVVIHASSLPEPGNYRALIFQADPHNLTVVRHFNSSCVTVSSLALSCGGLSGLLAEYDMYAYIIDPKGYFSNKVLIGHVVPPETFIASSNSSGSPSQVFLSSSSSSSSSAAVTGPSKSSSGSSATIVAAVVGTIAAIVILILVVVLAIANFVFLRTRAAARLRERQQQQHSYTSNCDTELPSSMQCSSQMPFSMQSTSSMLSTATSSMASINLDSRNFEINYEELKIEERIASGSFGTVYRGKWNQVQTVAVKEFRLDMSEATEEELQKFIAEFQNEVALLGNIRHRNVVNFYGASVRPPKYVIVTEFMEKGSLHSALHSKKNKIHFTWEQKLTLCSQIASAMAFLHAKGIIHRDLKCHNILLDSFLVAKVCDFGLAKSKNAFNAGQRQMTQAVGTPLYMAPEVVMGKAYDGSCDVFSFGIIMWEILTERIPYDTIAQSDVAMIHMKVSLEPDFRPELPKIDTTALTPQMQDSQQRYVDLFQRCWAADPAARPSFNDIFSTISAMEKEAQQQQQQQALKSPKKLSRKKSNFGGANNNNNNK